MGKRHKTVAGQPGADPTLPDVKLQIGGKERQLCFDFNAIVEAEKQTGLNLLRSIVEPTSAVNLRALLWSSLLRDEPGLTLEQVGAMIRPDNIPVIQKALLTAWFGSVGEPEETSKGEDQAKAESSPA